MRRRRLAVTDLNTGEILSPRMLWRVPKARSNRVSHKKPVEQHYGFVAVLAALGLWIAITTG